MNEGYKIWKKHVPSLYNILQTYELPSCLQTVDWFSESFNDNSWKSINILIGTNSVSSNAVYKVNVFLPTDESIMDTSIYSENKPETSVGTLGYVGTMGPTNT